MRKEILVDSQALKRSDMLDNLMYRRGRGAEVTDIDLQRRIEIIDGSGVRITASSSFA